MESLFDSEKSLIGFINELKSHADLTKDQETTHAVINQDKNTGFYLRIEYGYKPVNDE